MYRLLSLVLSLSVPVVASCGPVKMPSEMPGPVGCGRRDPRQSGPSTMSVAQNTVVKNNGMPGTVEPNEHGGMSWMYLRSAGSVFGESETADVFIFNAEGLLVANKTELRRQTGKGAG